MAEAVDGLLIYRKELIKSKKDIQADYDKAVMTLSGGSLGITIPFLKDIVLDQSSQYVFIILLAWFCWVISITSIFFSLHTSQLSFTKAINKIDNGIKKIINNEDEEAVYRIYDSLDDDLLNKATKILNIISSLAFIVGLLFMGCFFYLQIKL